MRPSIITLPARPKNLRFAVENLAEPRLAVDGATISIFDAIRSGETAPRIAAALRQIGERPVVVEINSPGGDYFEGVAAFNLLARHPAPVLVQVLGLAASAASVVAMAGGQIQIARNAEIMIHNAEGIVVGDRADMRSFAAVLEQLDAAITTTYAARTGLDAAEVARLMDAETFMGADRAVDLGFADALMDSDGPGRPKTFDSSAPQSRRDLEVALRYKLGFSKSQAVRVAAGGLQALHAPELDTEAIAATLAAHRNHWK